MEEPSQVQLELNELDWWSRWANVQLYGADSYLMHSTSFPEFFFNRAVLMGCDVELSTIDQIEKGFSGFALEPFFLVPESCAVLVGDLNSRGYLVLDRMSVLVLGSPNVLTEQKAVITWVEPGGEEGWARVYSQSFYGDDSQIRGVTNVVKSAVGSHESSFLEATVDGRLAGALALHRTKNVLGVYCVGTLPEFRGRGVAGTLLGQAARTGAAEGRSVVLQTFLSDGVEGFYLARGYARRYIKAVFGKRNRPG